MHRIVSFLCGALSRVSATKSHTYPLRSAWTIAELDPNEAKFTLTRQRTSGIRSVFVRLTQLVLLLPIVFVCTLTNAQTAFSSTSITMSWSEDPALQATQLATLNTDVRNALNASATDFCFAIETAPADLLDFSSLNCTIGNAASPNGYTASNASFALVLGNMPFDYDSGAAHTLTLTAQETSSTPNARTANSLRVSFTISNIDETPVLTDETFQYVAPPAHSGETRYLEVGDRIEYNIARLFRDPERAPVSLPLSTIEVCDTGVAGDFVENSSRCNSYSNLPASPDVLSVEARGPLLIATADGGGMSNAGVYWAKLYFGASDQTGNVTTKQEGANVTVFVKQGVNNPPSFGGGASGFSVAVDEVAAGHTSAVAINPLPLGAWDATDLDGGANSAHGDTIEYSLVGTQPNCRDTGVSAVAVGEMCIAVVQPPSGVALHGYFLDYESPSLSPTKSLSVTLRASDGWNHADVAIEITLMNINELYAHDDPSTQNVLPMTVRLLQGQSKRFNLDSYFTDPEMDNVTYTVFPNVFQDLVTHSGSSLTLTGVGTSANNPNVSDIVTVQATDGTIQLQRTIAVEVRFTNTPPRFEPAGVIGVAGDINENVPIGTAVSRLVQYEDDDSTADEIEVTLSSSDFGAIVDPFWDGSNVCHVASSSCERQTNMIAIVSAAAINFEETSSYDIVLGLHDGIEASDPNRNFTLTVRVMDVNDAPMPTGDVPNRTLSIQGSATFDVSEYFSDEDAGDRIIVNASSSNLSVVTVLVRGIAELTITGVATGTSTITLTASDIAGLTATQTFQVTVQTNQSPVANDSAFQSALPANLEILIDQTHEIPLDGLFTDPEGDDLTVDVESSAESVLLAAVTGSGESAVAVLTARAIGSADLTFTATDTAGNETAETRTIAVVSELSAENEPPEVNQAALDAVLPTNNEIVLGDHIEMTLTDLFSDPEGSDLTFAVESSDSSVVLLNLASDGVSLFLFADSIGTATITITATDGAGNSTPLEIEFRVVEEASTENRAPVLDRAAFSAALPTDNTMQQRNYHELDATSLFTDPDGDAFSVTVSSSNADVLRVSSVSESSTTFLIARSIGSSNLSVTATDTEDNTTTETVSIRVVANESDGENQPPVLDREAFNAALPANNTIPVPEFFELELDTLFTDPNPNDSVAEYDVSSSDHSVLLVVLDPGNILTAFARSAGTAMMTIVARDTEGAATTVTEDIRVIQPAANALVFGTQSLDRSAPLTMDVRDWLPDTGLRNAAFNLQPVVRDASVLDARVNGSLLTLSARTQGETFVKLTVTSDAGYSAKTMFFVNVVNAAPTLVRSLGDQRTTRTSNLTIDISDAFQDADGEPIHVTAQTLDDSIIQSTLDSGVLTINGLQVGETSVTLVAVDTNGATTEASFKVTVENIGPSVNAAVGPIQLQVGGEPYDLIFDDWFTDDDDTLTYTATLDTVGVVEVSEAKAGATFSPLTKGSVDLTVTATDPHGGVASLTTEIIVGDDLLMEAAAKSLAGFGRAMLGSVVSAIDKRTRMDRGSSDLSTDKNSADALDGWVASQSDYSLFQTPESVLSDAGSVRSIPLNGNWNGSNASRIAPGSFSPFDRGFSFTLGGNEKSTPWSVWSNVDQQSYGGEDYDGSVRNAYLGVDKVFGDTWVLGLTIARHHGESNYVYGTATQSMDIELNQLMPYFRFAPTDRSAIWGTIGMGKGELGTMVVGAEEVSSEFASQLAVIGGRQLIASTARFELAVRGDLAGSRLATSDGESASAGLEADVHRLRTGVETSYTLDLFEDTTLTPFGQFNLRADGGDGDSGTGLEFTGGLKLTRGAYSIELMGRTFETRAKQAYSESAVTMTANVNPSHDGSGFSAAISPRWGANVYMNDAFWRSSAYTEPRVHQLPFSDPSADDRRMHLDTQVGYGIRVVEERYLLTPFIQHTSSGSGTRQSQIGAQLREFGHTKGSISSRFTLSRTNRYNEQTQFRYGLSVHLNF